jgi:hypothetical protein
MILLAGGDDASFLLRLFRPSTWVNVSLTWLVCCGMRVLIIAS